MTEEKPTVGDIVLLKSGSPNMTLDYLNGGVAICKWFNNDILYEGKFTITSLKKYIKPMSQKKEPQILC